MPSFLACKLIDELGLSFAVAARLLGVYTSTINSRSRKITLPIKFIG